MSRCLKCGEKLKENAIFCPNCGFKVKYAVCFDELIGDLLYVDDRISKAKTIGVAVFLVYIFVNMIFIFPSMLRINFLLFLGAVIVVFIIGLFFYCVCRAIGFVVRKFIN